MLQVSNDFKTAHDAGNTLARVRITLADGQLLLVEEDEILENGITIERATSQPEAFTIGSIVIGKLTIAVFNADGKYNNYDFRGAVIQPFEVYDLGNDITEEVKLGEFIAERPSIAGSALTIVAYDNSSKLDRAYQSSLVMPQTAKAILKDACEACNIPYKADFDNDDVVIKQLPKLDGLTYRALLCYVAQITGNYGLCDSEGRLCFGWYDIETLRAGTRTDYANSAYKNFALNVFAGGNLVEGSQIDDYQSQTTYETFREWAKAQGFTETYSVTTDMWDIEITGVRVTIQNYEETTEGGTGGEGTSTLTYSAGTEGYVLDITDNLCIAPMDAQDVADRLLQRAQGFLFRPSSVTLAGNPLLEAGDVATLSDDNGLTCNTVFTTVVYNYGGSCSCTCGAEATNERLSVQVDRKSLDNYELRNAIGVAEAKAEGAAEAVQEAVDAAEIASEKAEQVESQMAEQHQYFWHDDLGAHVLSQKEGAFQARTDIKGDGMHIVSGVDSTELAKFTKDGAVIGNVNTSHVEQSPRKIAMFDKEQNQYFSAEDLRNQDNIATIIAIEDPAQYATEDGNACDIPLQFTPVQITEVRTRNGYIDARDYHVHIETEDETVIPYLYIDFSHVFALSKVRITYTTSNELYAFTLGKRAALDDDYPIYGANSFVMGKDNVAFGNYSAAFGNGVRATNPNQFVFGSYNAVPGYDRGDGTTVPDGEYLEIVGNGQGPLTYGTNYYDNARELDTHGNQWIAGTMDASGYKIEGESLLDMIYPVGSIIWSSDPDDPRTQIAGMTWTPIKDKFILAAGTTFGTSGSGGNKDAVVVSHSHTLTMDAHSHSFSVPNHTHSLNEGNFLSTTGAALSRKSIKPGSGTAVSNVLISPGAVERKANTASGGGSSNTTGGKTSTGSISTNGSSGSNANMPPYIIKYCWERTE